jgi:arsenate reductase (thioredoxin)
MSGTLQSGRAEPGTAATRVLFVCTHNSARSIMAEALLRARGGDGYEVFSAGTHAGAIRPQTLQVLEEAGLPTDGLRSKSVEEFMGRRFDFVITVCDRARGECPVFPGGGQREHWSFDDPSEVEGSEEAQLDAYRRTLRLISRRIDRFVRVERQPQTDG